MEFTPVIQGDSPISPEPLSKKKLRRSTPAQRKQLIKLWQKSPLSKVQFCLRHPLEPHTLSRWLRENKAGKKESHPALKKQRAETTTLPLYSLECQLPNGVILRIASTKNTIPLAAIMKELSQCKFN